MNIERLQNEVEKTEYWDMPILDIQFHYFGDEIELFIENDTDTCWKISFISCYKVSYKTDVNCRMINKVKNMNRKQLSYYGQDIALKKYAADENFVQCALHFSIMLMEIICKDIFVEKLQMNEVSFFGEDR